MTRPKVLLGPSIKAKRLSFKLTILRTKAIKPKKKIIKPKTDNKFLFIPLDMCHKDETNVVC